MATNRLHDGMSDAQILFRQRVVYQFIEFFRLTSRVQIFQVLPAIPNHGLNFPVVVVQCSQSGHIGKIWRNSSLGLTFGLQNQRKLGVIKWRVRQPKQMSNNRGDGASADNLRYLTPWRQFARADNKQRHSGLLRVEAGAVTGRFMIGRAFTAERLTMIGGDDNQGIPERAAPL